MKLDEDYKKVMNELQENFEWSNIDILPESHQDLLNDTIMAVKNLIIQRVIDMCCPYCKSEDIVWYGLSGDCVCNKCGKEGIIIL